MTFHLTLSPEMVERLRLAAASQGLTADSYVLQLLNQYVPSDGRRAEAVELLQSWIDAGDAAEQRDTGDYLIQALDEDRLADRKLFPDDLKGVTW